MENLELLLEMFVELFRFMAIFWPILLIVALPTIFSILVTLYKKWRLSKAGMEEIDQMKGKEFEIYLERLFKRLGYGVKRTPQQGDYGGDLLIKKNSLPDTFYADGNDSVLCHSERSVAE